MMAYSEDMYAVFEIIRDVLVAIRRIEYRKVEVFCSERGISKSTVAKLETRHLQLTHNNLEIYANALGIRYEVVLSFATTYMQTLKTAGEKRHTPIQEVFDFLMFLSKKKSDYSADRMP